MTTQNQVPELLTWDHPRSWREIAEEASIEKDGKRLLELTNELGCLVQDGSVRRAASERTRRSPSLEKKNPDPVVRDRGFGL